MSPDTEQPRQRTVAELLAAHGEAGAPGRRRRRRADDDGDGPADAPDEVAENGTAGHRGGTARHGGGTGRGAAPEVPDQPRAPEAPDLVGSSGPSTPVGPPRASRAEREDATEQFPRYRDPVAGSEPTGPIAVPAADVPDGSAPGDADAGGPPTQAGPLDLDAFDDHPAGLAPESDRRWADGGSADEDRADEDRAGGDGADGDGADGDEADGDEADRGGADGAEETARRRRKPSGAGQAWVAVLAQWIAGAVGGALLWVGFRYLWQSLPVVAAVAAVVVVIGLVVIVRALLHNDDRRTTVFAVLVGLLLTASPALLVFLGR